ncbi:hypothetical protein Fmac_005688 [Flemingia macrophylla]|uniref:GRAM domain-containing protein n=1 Tax=Flemingia macrophylla TaxID=520843 RepID=A0ABD1N9U6_9FABA
MEPPNPESYAPNANGHFTGSESEPHPRKDRGTASSGSTKKSVHWSPELVTESTFNSSPRESLSNPYFSNSSSVSQSPSPSFMETVVTVRNVLGRWGRKVGEATKKAENLAGNTWQHLKTSPSFTEAAMGRIAQGTKVLAEGGYEKIFLNTFETSPEERLQNSFACYLSTSAGPVMGVLYISTAKIAYSSDNPISYRTESQMEWSYYKVIIPLHELKSVHPSSNTTNPAEKYVQVISVDNHEFWFMGFLNYDGAVESLEQALQAGKHIQSEA